MARMTIDLSAIEANYKLLQKTVGSACETAAVVKANAYGLGIEPIAQKLQKAGCKSFFVAALPEAITLRAILGAEPLIAMLNGFKPRRASDYLTHSITPVINDLTELHAYKELGKKLGDTLPAILHIDTAMNRLGMNENDITPDHLNGLDIKFIMSHFVSSEKKTSDLNTTQATRFADIAVKFPNIPLSLCNSSGIFLDESYHFDIARPGMAIYGLNPTPYNKNPMQSAVTLKAEILQTKITNPNESVGYNETYRFDKKSYIAIVDIGYADGIFRSLSNTGKMFWNNIGCPIIGNVSMDLTIIDLTHLPENDRPQTGDFIEIIGANQSADKLARDAGTIGYEILTALGQRYERRYINP